MKRQICAAFLVLSALTALGDYETWFESPDVVGTRHGIELSGQDDWYTPTVDGSSPFSAYVYDDIVLPIHWNPKGTAQLAAGHIDNRDGLTPYRRTQRDIDFSGHDEWVIAYDFYCAFDGEGQAADYLASFSLQPTDGLARGFIQLNGWTQPTPPYGEPESWEAYYVGYHADGTQEPLPGFSPGAAWSKLQPRHWYRLTTAIRYSENRITRVGISDITSGEESIIDDPVDPNTNDWIYLGGGAFPGEQNPLPQSVRMFTGSGVTGTLSAWDNVNVGPRYAPPQTYHITGDSNCDGNVDFSDIDCYVAALIGADVWADCGTVCGGADFVCVNDTNRDGVVDFDDIDSFVACLIVGCTDVLGAYADLLPFGAALDFGTMPRATTPMQPFLVYNRTDGPVVVTDAEATGDFLVTGFDRTIDPQTAGWVYVAYTPSDNPDASGALMLQTDPSYGDIVLPLSGGAYDLVEGSLQDTTSMTLTPEATLALDEGVYLTYLVEIPATGPTLATAHMDLFVEGYWPADLQMALSIDRVELGANEIVELTLFAPRGTAPDDADVQVVGNVYIDQVYQFNVASNDVYIPGATFTMPAGNCKCDKPFTPVSLDSKKFVIPNPNPAKGKTPATDPLGELRVDLSGPSQGDCCKVSKFTLTATLDSTTGGANNNSMAWKLLNSACPKNGHSAKSYTTGDDPNGAGPKFERDKKDTTIACDKVPKAPPAGGVGRAVINTSKSVPTSCAASHSKCPCSVSPDKLKTTIKLSGDNPLQFDIYWTISLASTDDCLVDTATGEITAIVMIVPGLPDKVYDPISDSFLDKTGDVDGDGFNNGDEVKEGFDPKDPSKHPPKK